MNCPFCNKELPIIKTESLDDGSENILGRCKNCQYEAIYKNINNEEQLIKYKKCYYTKEEIQDIWKEEIN